LRNAALDDYSLQEYATIKSEKFTDILEENTALSSTYRSEAARSVILQNAAKCLPHCMVSQRSRWQIS